MRCPVKNVVGGVFFVVLVPVGHLCPKQLWRRRKSAFVAPYQLDILSIATFILIGTSIWDCKSLAFSRLDFEAWISFEGKENNLEYFSFHFIFDLTNKTSPLVCHKYATGRKITFVGNTCRLLVFLTELEACLQWFVHTRFLASDGLF